MDPNSAGSEFSPNPGTKPLKSVNSESFSSSISFDLRQHIILFPVSRVRIRFQNPRTIESGPVCSNLGQSGPDLVAELQESRVRTRMQ